MNANFPNTVNLNITERTIAAIVDMKVDDSATSETWALSSDGMWLMKIPDQNSEEGKALAQTIYDDAARALRITDVPYGSKPEAGTLCDNANIENALTIISGMSTDLAGRVKNVAASMPNRQHLPLIMVLKWLLAMLKTYEIKNASFFS